MKILLLTDIPLCDNLTAGLVLSSMARMVPRDGLCCFTVANPFLHFEIPADLAGMPMETHTKPNENWLWLRNRRFTRPLAPLAGYLGERLTERVVIPPLIEKAVAFGQRENVDRVWAVLQGQTMIRMAKAVAEQLGVPLHTQVWDPFSWWSRANGLDRFTEERVQALFRETIRASQCVAAASEPMAQLFQARDKAEAIPVISSHPASLAQRPADLADDGSIIIGMAGQFYAAEEWLQLLHGLRSADWRIKGRCVRIVVVGPQPPPGADSAHVSYLGWKQQTDAALILSQCDVLYCPYPFDEGMREVAEYSFPSKLVLYLAAGRPVVFHGPACSAPARYVESRNCGLLARQRVATSVYNELERLFVNPKMRETMAVNGRRAFQEDFTLDSMRNAFARFIGGDLSDRSSSSCGAPGSPKVVKAAQPIAFHRALILRQRVHRLVKNIQSARLHMRGAVKSVARRAVLHVPFIESLHHEVRRLTAEKNDLLRQVGELEAALRSVPSNPAPTVQELASAAVMPGTDSRPTDPVEDVLRLYPGQRILVLTDKNDDALDAPEVSPDGRARDFPHPAAPLVRLRRSETAQSLAPPRMIDAALQDVDRDIMKRLLRMIFAGDLQRVVYLGDCPYNLSRAARLGQFASIPVSAAVTAGAKSSAISVAHAMGNVILLEMDIVEAVEPPQRNRRRKTALKTAARKASPQRAGG